MEKQLELRRKPLAVAVTAACMAMSANAPAQEGAGPVIEEILVTATRREASVQDIPYNISAMSGDYLVDVHNVVNQYDVLRAMYGVTVVDRGYRNSGTVNNIVIRGLNVDNGANGDIMLNAVPTVATYYDNTPLFANFLVKDIERVEVLRGPQGTLYGSGSLGGTVRYIANVPDPQAFDASVEVDFGTTSGSGGNNLAFDGMINVPIGDRTALRAAYSRIDNDGVIDYVNVYQLNEFREPLIDVDGQCVDPRDATDQQILFNTGCFREAEDADTVEIDYYKLALRSNITDSLSVQLNYHRQEDEIGARRSTTVGDNGQPPGSDLFFAYGDDDSGQVILEPSSREVDLASLDVEVDFGFATFTSTTSTYDHTGVGESDNGGLWASGGRDWNFLFYGGQWPRPIQRAERGYEDEAFIQEFRLVSKTGESFDWILGAYWMDQETSVYQLSWNPGMNLFKNACRDTGDVICTIGGIYGGFWPRFYAGDLSEIDFEYVRDTDYEERAVYGEVTYHFSDTFRLTGGFRWFDNETVNDTILGFPLPPGSTSPAAPQSTDSDDDVLVKLNASWDLNPSAMLYTTYSEGYRHGGAQAVPSLENGDPFGEPNAEAIRTFESDSVKNYEIGIKGGTDAFQYTAAAFYVDWEDPQLNTTSAFFGFFLAANGQEATTRGIELEFEGYLTDTLHYRVGYTWLEAELDKDFISPQTGAVVAPQGSDLPGAPNNTLSFNVDSRWQLGTDMELVAGVNGYYQSEAENFINQSSVLNETYESFLLLGASASLTRDNWQATLYVRNLTDEEGVSGGFPSAYWSYDTGIFENWYGNGNRRFIVEPRTIGLRLGYRF
ncbi:TonB-dependent receptor [Lentisalinibacter orientalis]|uniref:TonB-dependent receptor n=1 Tax=Lentisalinibacter orientalis TaxID=2992241 RepID=UPI0038705183